MADAVQTGTKAIPGASFPISKFWYSVATIKHPTGYFLFVGITQIEPPQTTGFAVVNFPKGIPPQLK